MTGAWKKGLRIAAAIAAAAILAAGILTSRGQKEELKVVDSRLIAPAEQGGIAAARPESGDPVNGPAVELYSRAGPAAAPEAEDDGLIDINSAGAEELETLPGIGPVKAAAIIAYREAYGGFVSIEEITEVKGIGPATLEKIRGLIKASQ